jgi:hypothetical protein
LGSLINRGVRRGEAKRGREESLKGGAKVGIVVRVGSSSLNVVSLFLRGN